MENLQDFIKNYFSLLNVRNMSETVLDSYKKYIDKDDFPNKTVKSWSTKLMKPGTTSWNDLPTFKTLSDDELNLLYVDLLRTFESMSSHTNNMDDDTKNLINTYYGAGKVFDVVPISGAVKAQIETLIKYVLKDADVKAMDLLYGEYDAESTLRAVLDGRKKYEDQDVKKLVHTMISNYRQLKRNGYLSAQAAAKLDPLSWDHMQDAVKKFDVDDVTPTNRTDLQKNCAKIFETLFKKEKTRDAFKKYEPGEKFVSEQIDAALSDTDYTGKIKEENYVAPTYKDDKNLRQKIDEKLEETYSDVLKKYLTLHRANLFMKPEAKKIFEVLDKEKLKPTYGLEKVLEKAGDITNKLKGKSPFEAAGHFKWLTGKLSDYKDHGMGKAIAGALRNGHQMRHIIEQLIIDAVKEGKTKEAKTAMEVLSVMQYGMFEGRRLDAVNAATKDMKLLNDSSYSWMKKDSATEFIANAANSALGFGIRAVTFGAAGITNSIRRTNRTFNHSGKVNDKSNEKIAELKKDKDEFDKDRAKKDTDDNTLIHNEEMRRTGTGITDLDVSKNKLERDRITESRRKMVYDGRQSQFEALKKIDNDYNENQRLETECTNLTNEITRLEQLLMSVPGVAPTAYGATAIDAKKQELIQKKSDLQQKEDKINQLTASYGGVTGLYAEHNRIHTVNPLATQSEYDKARNKLNNAQTAYENQRDANNDLADKINTYEEATENIDTAQKQIVERKKAADKWADNNKNEYLELMGYWDFLQSGNTKSLFHWSTKNLQDKMDKGRMNTIYTQWMQQHHYAA